ncbi:ThuA domain-containing protein [Nonomuraea zeae]|uniref:Carbohydrate-binding protein n=1 Tax=Nonomuraea zeae TaxID=1642303 RepID=A0A5S4GJS8_9ACTN|nr:ThuA domain-containing protein [Nonomuraea zeae]TMR33129.1 carbohydrate-binding protein [Nonomuraea zeae]
MFRIIGIVLATLICAISPPAASAAGAAGATAAAYQVLVFSKTAGFRHDSIPAGVEAVRSLGAAGGFTVTATEDAGAFTPANLANYRAVVFLSTTGDVLADSQQAALQSYVDGGGGFVGVHAAADTEYGWPYYGQLVGAWFKSHPAIQQAVVRNEDRTHPATAHLGPTWTRTDEWYDYRTNPRPGVRVLQTLDETSYSGGTMGADHPITWYHAQGAGRSFYTGLGHTIESYSDGNFRQLLLGGIQYAAGVTATPVTTEGEAYTSGQGVQIAAHAPASGGRTLGYIDNGDWAGYAQVSTAGAKTFSARVSSAGAGGTVQVRAGSATGTLLGTVTVPVTGGWETFQTVTTALTGAGSGPLFLVFAGGAGSLFDIDTFTLSTGTTAQVSPNVHVFYYPWYGSPSVSGAWRHWPQGGHTPPADIGADLYPKLGPYDSGDLAAIDQHMKWIRQSGAGVLVYSWWGRGGYEDGLARRVMDAAQREGVKVAWHIEPYAGRTAASVVSDVQYLNQTYGAHPAFRNAFYVFESLKITDWTALDQVTAANIVLAQTTDTSKIAHFSGMYTYDAIAGATAPGWQQAAAYAKQHNLVWAPSVGPGYIDDRAVPGNTTPTLARDNGATYDKEWANAIATAPTWVSITSFNEWHEGSVLEPAVVRSGYQSFEGAYGRTGAAAETAYLDRTRYWVTQFEPQTASPAPR